MSDEVEHEQRRRRRDLRRRSTKPETLIWTALRNRKLNDWKFRRQHSIGPFIVDFCCPELKLVIELDGGYHDEVYARDQRRQKYLEREGFKVIRFRNEDVLEDAEAVATAIKREIDTCDP